MRPNSILVKLSAVIVLFQEALSYYRKRGFKQTFLLIFSFHPSDYRVFITLLSWLKMLPWNTPNAIRWFDEIRPEVSIVVLNFNQTRMTLELLGSIWEHTAGHRYEIIVVDNGSNLINAKVLRLIRRRAKIVSLKKNRYFGEGNNIGAEFAKAPYLVFMNNDIIVHEGWLEPLIARLSDSAQIGGVAPRFIYPDGRLQEAGAFIGPDGAVVQRGKYGDPWASELSVAGPVDCVSAATFAVRRNTFEEVLGFDLAFEPAHYEDVDLCMKIRALGMQIWYEPAATVTHIESVTNSNPRHGLNLQNMEEINRSRFLAKWGNFLSSASPRKFITNDESLLKKEAVHIRSGLPSLALYSPYTLSIGGGERYLLSIAQAMSAEYSVYLVTPEKWSRIRILTLAQELGLELAQLQLIPIYEIGDKIFDVFVAMGNSILPPIAPLGKINIYHCQFPFPTFVNRFSAGYFFWDSYNCLVVNSGFTREHCLLKTKRHGLEAHPIKVISPPVAMLDSMIENADKTLAIANIGRFSPGGHCKRQDALISVFRKLVQESGIKAELHLIGSIPPESQHRDYLLTCMELAKGLPVYFHLNTSLQELRHTLQHSLIYWHGTGYAVDAAQEPSKCEHFGISIVEAMSAGCIPMAVRSGGPCETIEEGKSGYLWSDLDELQRITEKVLLAANMPWVNAISKNAFARAQHYSDDEFGIKWRSLIKVAVENDKRRGF